VAIPRRTLLLGVVVFALAALFVRLGFWQLQRLHERRERNAAWEGAMARPPVTLDSAVWEAIQADPERWANRRVRLQGSYDPAGEVVLRGRSQDGKPGVHLVTPMVLAGTRLGVMVNRGFAPSPDAATVDTRPLAEPGSRTAEGVLQPIPATGDGGQPAETGTGAARILTYRRLDLAELRANSPRPLLPLYVQQLPAAGERRDRPPFRVPVPDLSEGNHLSYAVQWFSFAAIAVVGFLVLALRHRPGSRPA
jgi:surfeit locus 1 family protein